MYSVLRRYSLLITMIHHKKMTYSPGFLNSQLVDLSTTEELFPAHGIDGRIGVWRSTEHIPTMRYVPGDIKAKMRLTDLFMYLLRNSMVLSIQEFSSQIIRFRSLSAMADYRWTSLKIGSKSRLLVTPKHTKKRVDCSSSRNKREGLYSNSRPRNPSTKPRPSNADTCRRVPKTSTRISSIRKFTRCNSQSTWSFKIPHHHSFKERYHIHGTSMVQSWAWTRRESCSKPLAHSYNQTTNTRTSCKTQRMVKRLKWCSLISAKQCAKLNLFLQEQFR